MAFVYPCWSNINLLPLIGLEILPWTQLLTWSTYGRTYYTLTDNPRPRGHKNQLEMTLSYENKTKLLNKKQNSTYKMQANDENVTMSVHKITDQCKSHCILIELILLSSF